MCIIYVFYDFAFYQSKDCQQKSNYHCYFSSQDSEVEGDSNGDLQIASPGSSEAQQALAQFWPKVTEEIKKITTVSNSLSIGIISNSFFKKECFRRWT